MSERRAGFWLVEPTICLDYDLVLLGRAGDRYMSDSLQLCSREFSRVLCTKCYVPKTLQLIFFWSKRTVMRYTEEDLYELVVPVKCKSQPSTLRSHVKHVKSKSQGTYFLFLFFVRTQRADHFIHIDSTRNSTETKNTITFM